MSARILDLNAGGSRLARMCTAAFSWARRGPVAIPGRATLGPDELMPELAVRLRLLRQLGGNQAVVEVDEAFVPHECTWCYPRRPGITSVRVFGNPRQGDVTRPLIAVAVCLRCALGGPSPTGRAPRLGAVGQALFELRPGSAIRIEVCE